MQENILQLMLSSSAPTLSAPFLSTLVQKTATGPVVSRLNFSVVLGFLWRRFFPSPLWFHVAIAIKTVYIHYIYSYMSFTSLKCHKKTCCEGRELNLQIICLGWFGFCFISGAFCVRVATLLIMLSRKAALSAFSWPQISLSISIMWDIF